MMRALALVLVALLATGCGNKGKLKSPVQMRYEQEKAERRAGKKEGAAETSADVRQADPNAPAVPAESGEVLYRGALPPVPSNNVGE